MCDLAREAGQGGAGTWWVGERMHLAVSSLCLPRGTSTTATPASPGVDAHAIGVCIHVWAPSGACSTGVWNGYVNRVARAVPDKATVRASARLSSLRSSSQLNYNEGAAQPMVVEPLEIDVSRASAPDDGASGAGCTTCGQPERFICIHTC